MTFDSSRGLRLKVPAWVANRLVGFLDEGTTPNRYVVDLLLHHVLEKERERREQKTEITSDDPIAIRDNQQVTENPPPTS